VENDEDKDPLTGLLRAGAFQRQLDELTRLAASGQVELDSFTVILVKIRNFSEVYARHGKATGDQLLIAVADRLVHGFKAQCVARVGGDQFALLRKRPDGESTGQWARGIRIKLSDPYQVGPENFFLKFHVTFVNGPKADGGDLLWTVMRVAQDEVERSSDQELEASRQLVQSAQGLLLENVALKENNAVLAYNSDAMKKDLEDLRLEANTDYLTALLNRRGLDRALLSGQQLTALAFVDLDDLKSINEGDQLWNDGDAAIAGVARILRQCLDTALVARWGGDEFLIAEMQQGADTLHSLLVDLVEMCRLELIVAGRPVTFSAGVTTFESNFGSSCAIAQRRVKMAKRSRATVISED
jgi:diguanylate cyclase (GGDEF)-like protein